MKLEPASPLNLALWAMSLISYAYGLTRLPFMTPTLFAVLFSAVAACAAAMIYSGGFGRKPPQDGEDAT